MHSLLSRIASLLTLFSTLALVACASTKGGQSNASTTSSPQVVTGGVSSGYMVGGTGDAPMMNGSSGQIGMGQMDRESMCAMYRQMQGARTPEERQALMNQRMPGMSAEMQQRHIQMMQQQCQ